ncbi:DUF6351 family protein [Nocardioides sp.]|uniref:DUF6351 family protein n=1 Tax=Nocardioides sp. TaxID=35761 RepID=UPI0035142E57
MRRPLRRGPLALLALVVALPLLPLLLTPGGAGLLPGAGAAPAEGLRILAVSTRPDLVTDGDVRVEIVLPDGVRPREVRVTAGNRDVTDAFAVRRGGAFEGLVSGLRPGATTITATAPGRSGTLAVVNHDTSGPVFSGPQSTYYRCQPTARDRGCSEPARYRLLYASSNPLRPGLLPYDEKNPPSDVATTTTDEGVRVPFIVRKETGYALRDRYTIFVLWRPGRAWDPFAPPSQFNRKLLITHGGGCGASYTPADPPTGDFSGTIPVAIPGLQESYVAALSKGFGVMATALANTGHHCNPVVNAESLVLAKERFVEQYGRLRYTIGTGCSGGSIAQYTVANAYPGVYQGLVTTCSYPDTFTAGAQFADYHLLRGYFERPQRWGTGVVWTQEQMAAVEGHLSIVNGIVADEGLFKAALDPEHPCPGTTAPKRGDTRTRYDSRINPGGVRCSVLDLLINPLAPRPRSAWGPEEKQVGRGFGGIPFGNAGLQYGLKQLRSGLITPAQFVDLNAAIGGLDVDERRTRARTVGDVASVRNAYRTGLINEAGGLSEVAIIDHGGPDPGAAHDTAHTFWTQERLRRAQGHTDNRVMWFGLVPLIGDPRWAVEALFEMDRWLSRIEVDRRDVPLARKVVQDRPANLTDRCSNIPGILEVERDGRTRCVQPERLRLRLSTPREQAGGPTTNDVLACRLKPLRRADYDQLIPFTDDQWRTLQRIFPDGVCDFSRRGIGQSQARTWLGYSDADGDVVYGGRELPGVARGQASGWAGGVWADLVRR